MLTFQELTHVWHETLTYLIRLPFRAKNLLYNCFDSFWPVWFQLCLEAKKTSFLWFVLRISDHLKNVKNYNFSLKFSTIQIFIYLWCSVENKSYIIKQHFIFWAPQKFLLQKLNYKTQKWKQRYVGLGTVVCKKV